MFLSRLPASMSLNTDGICIPVPTPSRISRVAVTTSSLQGFSAQKKTHTRDAGLEELGNSQITRGRRRGNPENKVKAATTPSADRSAAAQDGSSHDSPTSSSPPAPAPKKPHSTFSTDDIGDPSGSGPSRDWVSPAIPRLMTSTPCRTARLPDPQAVARRLRIYLADNHSYSSPRS